MPRIPTIRPALGSLRPRVAPAPKVADAIYTSPEWRQLVASIRRERGNACEKCGATGCRIIGDHIREIRDGGTTLDRRNVMLLCMPCHSKKTAKAKRQRMQR